jgi:hypothetical protein
MNFFKVAIISSLTMYSLSSLAYRMTKEAVGDSKTRVEYTVTCGNGQQSIMRLNANQAHAEELAREFCKNRGGLAKRDGIKSNFGIEAPKPVLIPGKIQKAP